jgi:hypothetical protein
MYIGQVIDKPMTTCIQKSQRLFTYTNSMTFYTPFYHIKPSKCLVFSVCPACYRPSPVSCVTFLSLIILKIIPHPMTLLIVFLLQVIISYISFYITYYRFSTIALLICCLVVISRVLVSIIPIVYTPLS